MTAKNTDTKQALALKLAAFPHLYSDGFIHAVFLSHLKVVVVPQKKSELFLIVLQPFHEVKLRAGEATELNFTVINKGQAATVTFEVS